MSLRDEARLSRRTYLSAVSGVLGGSALGAGTVAGRQRAPFVLAQGDRCVPLRPLTGSEPVEEFYDYQLPADRYEGVGTSDDGGPYFSSGGTVDLQRVDTSLLFLYDGPGGLSLVLVHGKVDESANGGGSATFAFEGLPADGEWVVQDDRYVDRETGERAASNYDRWDLRETTARIAWTWASTGTDGGVFRGLEPDTQLAIDPAFNDQADRLAVNYSGTVTDWQALSARSGGVRRYGLQLDQPLLLTTDTCESLGTVRRPSGRDRRERSDRTGGEDRDDDEDRDDAPRGPDGDGPPGPDGDGPPGRDDDDDGELLEVGDDDDEDDDDDGALLEVGDDDDDEDDD
jgi:hypothetical protein